MKTEIIPAVIEDGWQATEGKIKRLEGKSKWVHLDASDGVFTNHKTWDNPEDLAGLDAKVFVEAHLMVADVVNVLDSWLVGVVKRIIIHLETLESKDFAQTVRKIKESGREIVLAINPETSLQELEPFFETVDGILVMGVDPGWSGAEFKPETYDKIKSLREVWPNGIIEVDGGVNDERAPGLVSAGADRLVSSSFVWSSGDPESGINRLADSIEK